MLKLTGLTSSPKQTLNIVEPTTGIKIYFTFYFKPRIHSWYFDVEYDDFTAKGNKLIRGLNIINRFKNRVPFGIGVTVSDNYEPFLINDFTTGRVKIILLTSDEVTEIDGYIADGYTIA